MLHNYVRNYTTTILDDAEPVAESFKRAPNIGPFIKCSNLDQQH